MSLLTSAVGASPLAFSDARIVLFSETLCSMPQWRAASLGARTIRHRQRLPCDAPAADSGRGSAHDSRTMSAVRVSVMQASLPSGELVYRCCSIGARGCATKSGCSVLSESDKIVKFVRLYGLTEGLTVTVDLKVWLSTLSPRERG